MCFPTTMADVRDSVEGNVSGDEEDVDKQGLRATEHDLEQANSKAVFNSKKALWGFLVLCYSVRGD